MRLRELQSAKENIEDTKRERMKSRREGGRGCNEKEMLPEEEERMWNKEERNRYTFHGAWFQMGVYPISYCLGLSAGPHFTMIEQ